MSRKKYYYSEPQEPVFEARECEESLRAFVAAQKRRGMERLCESLGVAVPQHSEEAGSESLEQFLFNLDLEHLRLRNEDEYICWVAEQLQRFLLEKERETRARARLDHDGFDKLHSFCENEDEFTFLVDALVHGAHPELMAQVPERSRAILERRWSDQADEHIIQSIAAERQCSVAEVRGLYDAGLRCLLALRAEGHYEEPPASESSEPLARHSTGLSPVPRTPITGAHPIPSFDIVGGADLLDGSRHLGWAVRDRGRFGSFPLHDDYGDESNA